MSMETHREYIGYLYEWDGTPMLTDEEIVRCRDCKRFSLDDSDHDYRSGWWCHRWNTDMVKPDGFCAWGVQR